MNDRQMVTPEESHKRLLLAIHLSRKDGRGLPSAETYINVYLSALPMAVWEDLDELEELGDQSWENLWDRQDMYLELSWEAKQVIRLILNSPSELLSELSPKNKNGLSLASRDRICSYIRKKLGFRPRVTREVIDELSSYSRELGKF